MQPRSTILVVDDDAALVKMLNIRLEAEGYETELAVDGNTAVALAAEKHPDVILLDIAMPGVNGVDVIKKLQGGDGSDIPVIVMTAYPSMLPTVRDFPSVRACFVKPFDLPKMLAKVAEVLSNGPGAEEG